MRDVKDCYAESTSVNFSGTQILAQQHQAPRDHSTIMSAKKLPKKRKFDPSELEESDNCATSVLMPPQSTAMDCSNTSLEVSPRNFYVKQERCPSRENIPLATENNAGGAYPPNMGNMGLSLLLPMTEQPMVDRVVTNGKNEIDLREWIDHRVLAKKDQVYLPGIIKQAGTRGEVMVEFDDFPDKPEVIFALFNIIPMLVMNRVSNS